MKESFTFKSEIEGLKEQIDRAANERLITRSEALEQIVVLGLPLFKQTVPQEVYFPDSLPIPEAEPIAINK